jgi:DNA-binding transcriptional ArsR family regulator
MARGDSSDRLGRLLLHPLRHRLLLEYSGEPDSPGQLARRLGEPLNVVSYHTRVLLRAGFVELIRTERRRGALTRFYRATVTPAIEDAQWSALPEAVRRSLTLATLAQAADEAKRAALDGAFDVPAAHLSRTPLELDEAGALEVSHCLRAALAEAARIAAACRGRGTPRTPCEIVLLGFEPESLAGTRRAARS